MPMHARRMVLYRRQRVPGGTYFFTAILADRSSQLLVEHIDSLRCAYAAVRKRHPFRTDAIVILPDHLHCLWTLPEGDAAYSMRWRLIKTRFTAALIAAGVRPARRRQDERVIWQPRFWEHLIRDEEDLQHHIDYIHVNPIKHGLAARVADWPYSSFHRYHSQGKLPKDWAGSLESSAKSCR